MRVPLRRRITNELHEPVPIDRLVRHGPLAFFQTGLRLAFGVRPMAPWIPFDAAARLLRHLENRPAATVLEYGSGMSTIWFAQHAAHVVSVESNHAWATKVGQLLHARGLTDRVRLVQTGDREQYVKAGDIIPKEIDLLVVDGDHRLETALHAMRFCRANGAIYVDDTDKRGAVEEIRQLVDSVQRHAELAGGWWEYVTDFSPAQAFPKEGLIAWLSPRSSGQPVNTW